MRQYKALVFVVLSVLALVVLAGAAQNKFGVADVRHVTFAEPMRVGDVLLPKGEYEVQHTMQGADHIMIFRQMNTKGQPAEAHVKCQLVPLPKKADQTEQQFALNSAKERVLHVLVFQGDTAQHVF